MRNLRLLYNIVTHKFYGAQGLHLHLNLTKRNYKLKVQTIWEDYGTVEIQGLSGIKNYIFNDNGLIGHISDQQLDQNYEENIDMTLKIPEYSSYQAKIYGSVDHVKTFVDSKLRGPFFSIKVLSKGSNINLKYIQGQKFQFINPFGNINIQTLIGKTGNIQCLGFQAQKIMISQYISVKCQNGYLRSLLLQNSQAQIESKNFKCDSIQGKANIKSLQKLIINRWYSGQDQITVDAQNYQLKIQSGTGKIKGKGIIDLGKTHKGKIENTQQLNELRIKDKH